MEKQKGSFFLLAFSLTCISRGQLFSSTNCSISLYCGSDWLPTSQLLWSPNHLNLSFSSHPPWMSLHFILDILILDQYPSYYTYTSISTFSFLLPTSSKLGAIYWPTLYTIQQSQSNHHSIKLTFQVLVIPSCYIRGWMEANTSSIPHKYNM